MSPLVNEIVSRHLDHGRGRDESFRHCFRYATGPWEMRGDCLNFAQCVEMMRNLWVGGLRTVGPSTVRVPGGVMPQKSRRGFPHSQAARGYPAFRLRLNSGAALHPRIKDAECCAGATRPGAARWMKLKRWVATRPLVSSVLRAPLPGTSFRCCP
jgi:hypothetical protein